MFDDMLTAGKVRKLYGAGALHLLQTMRVGHRVGPDRTERHGVRTMQLFRKDRVQQAACFMVKGVAAPEYCSQAFFCGLFGVTRKEMVPEQEVYFRAGTLIKDRLDKARLDERREDRPKHVNQVVTSPRPRNLKPKNLLDWPHLR
jgi:hypothetical protein